MTNKPTEGYTKALMKTIRLHAYHTFIFWGCFIIRSWTFWYMLCKWEFLFITFATVLTLIQSFLWLASAQVIFIFNSKNVDLFFYQWVSKSVHIIKYSFLVLLPVCLFPFFIDLYFRTSAEVFVFSEKLHLGFSIGLYIILLKDKMLFISFVVHTIDNINFCYSKSCYNTGRWSNMNAMIQQNVLRWS